MKRPVAGVVYALAAAALFGASTPLAKLLVGRVEPVLLAGLLYLGSGCGLLAWRSLAGWGRRQGRSEAPLLRADVPWLAGAVLTGGVDAVRTGFVRLMQAVGRPDSTCPK